MSNYPLVSILITYYFKKEFIQKTLKSILNQSYKNYEIIFINDNGNSTDKKFINNVMKLFKKKKIIVNQKNIGVAKSRNIGLRYCKGEYIAFLDSDDIWNNNKLKIQLDYMLKYNLNFTFTSYGIIDENGKNIKNKIVTFDPTYNILKKKNIIGLSTVIFNKKIMKYIKFPSLKTQEDFALWLDLLKKGIKLSHVKKSLSSWRKTSNSLSTNNFQKIKDAFKLYYKLQNKNLLISIYSVLVLSYNKLFK